MIIRNLFAFTFLLLLFSFKLFGLEPVSILQKKFNNAQVGDYIVTLQEGHYNLLFVHTINKECLVLEEVSIPERLLNLKNTHWQNWLNQRAPGHTSWTLYEIDRQKNSLIECYSYSKRSWLYLTDSESFFSKLLGMPFQPISIDERKKIGPAPLQNEEDRRPVWNPPIIQNGKKITNSVIEAFSGKWSKDSSLLSLCTIEIYFNANDPQFPFPYWIEIKSPHYAFKMPVIDSGRELKSPLPQKMPHRSPQFLKSSHTTPDWHLFVKTPSYYENFRLFAIDLDTTERKRISIPFTKESTGNEEVVLKISAKELQTLLMHSHRYQWLLIPESSQDLFVESQEIFTWND